MLQAPYDHQRVMQACMMTGRSDTHSTNRPPKIPAMHPGEESMALRNCHSLHALDIKCGLVPPSNVIKTGELLRSFTERSLFRPVDHASSNSRSLADGSIHDTPQPPAFPVQLKPFENPMAPPSRGNRSWAHLPEEVRPTPLLRQIRVPAYETRHGFPTPEQSFFECKGSSGALTPMAVPGLRGDDSMQQLPHVPGPHPTPFARSGHIGVRTIANAQSTASPATQSRTRPELQPTRWKGVNPASTHSGVRMFGYGPAPTQTFSKPDDVTMRASTPDKRMANFAGQTLQLRTQGRRLPKGENVAAGAPTVFRQPSDAGDTSVFHQQLDIFRSERAFPGKGSEAMRPADGGIPLPLQTFPSTATGLASTAKASPQVGDRCFSVLANADDPPREEERRPRRPPATSYASMCVDEELEEQAPEGAHATQEQPRTEDLERGSYRSMSTASVVGDESHPCKATRDIKLQRQAHRLELQQKLNDLKQKPQDGWQHPRCQQAVSQPAALQEQWDAWQTLSVLQQADWRERPLGDAPLQRPLQISPHSTEELGGFPDEANQRQLYTLQLQEADERWQPGAPASFELQTSPLLAEQEHAVAYQQTPQRQAGDRLVTIQFPPSVDSGYLAVSPKWLPDTPLEFREGSAPSTAVADDVADQLPLTHRILYKPHQTEIEPYDVRRSASATVASPFSVPVPDRPRTSTVWPLIGSPNVGTRHLPNAPAFGPPVGRAPCQSAQLLSPAPNIPLQFSGCSAFKERLEHQPVRDSTPLRSQYLAPECQLREHVLREHDAQQRHQESYAHPVAKWNQYSAQQLPHQSDGIVETTSDSEPTPSYMSQAPSVKDLQISCGPNIDAYDAASAQSINSAFDCPKASDVPAVSACGESDSLWELNPSSAAAYEIADLRSNKEPDAKTETNEINAFGMACQASEDNQEQWEMMACRRQTKRRSLSFSPARRQLAGGIVSGDSAAVATKYLSSGSAGCDASIRSTVENLSCQHCGRKFTKAASHVKHEGVCLRVFGSRRSPPRNTDRASVSPAPPLPDDFLNGIAVLRGQCQFCRRSFAVSCLERHTKFCKNSAPHKAKKKESTNHRIENVSRVQTGCGVAVSSQSLAPKKPTENEKQNVTTRQAAFDQKARRAPEQSPPTNVRELVCPPKSERCIGDSSVRASSHAGTRGPLLRKSQRLLHRRRVSPRKRAKSKPSPRMDDSVLERARKAKKKSAPPEIVVAKEENEHTITLESGNPRRKLQAAREARFRARGNATRGSLDQCKLFGTLFETPKTTQERDANSTFDTLARVQRQLSLPATPPSRASAHYVNLCRASSMSSRREIHNSSSENSTVRAARRQSSRDGAVSSLRLCNGLGVDSATAWNSLGLCNGLE